MPAKKPAAPDLRPFLVRPTEDEHAILRRAAAVADEKVSAFALRAALERAEKILKNSSHKA